ncbi:MAG TPA: hypothetical protein VFQ77_22405 [Pseudonocardiaceae bacterium]|jgi:hypothetical protein|nr:hypothetical protein [Pseudonocardiaceae bacterium]
MSRGGAVPKVAPVGWVFLDGYTVRWRRGDPVAHVLAGQQVGSHGSAGVLSTIPVFDFQGSAATPPPRRLNRRWHSGLRLLGLGRLGRR